VIALRERSSRQTTTDRPPSGANLRRFGPIVAPQLYEQIADHLNGLVLSGALARLRPA
jgi:hypothetical protein